MLQFTSCRIDAIQVKEWELQDTILRISHFAAKPGKTNIGLKEIVDGVARLGEPPQVVDSLRQLLTPILNTFPRSETLELNISSLLTFNPG